LDLYSKFSRMLVCVSDFMSRWTGVGLIALAAILALPVFLDICGFVAGCTGWNAINPFCYLGYATCQGVQLIVKVILALSAFAIFLAGVWKVIKG